MKKLFACAAIAAVALTACKKDVSRKMTVVKDCTGTYLRFEDKDYHVCNTEKLAGHSSGDIVTASYKTVAQCKARENEIVCMMYHQNEGWIEVTSIR